MIAAAPIAAGDMPLFAQGETDESPRPVPRERRISAIAAATNAPPMTAAHDTPDAVSSSGLTGSMVGHSCEGGAGWHQRIGATRVGRHARTGTYDDAGAASVSR